MVGNVGDRTVVLGQVVVSPVQPYLTQVAQQVLDSGTTLYAGAVQAGIELADPRGLQLLTVKPFMAEASLDERA
jgi:hypothetical protein